MTKREPSDWVEGIDCFADEITCPYCLEIDYEHTDYPHSLRHDGDTAHHHCADCGNVFKVTVCVDYTFRSRKESEASDG